MILIYGPKGSGKTVLRAYLKKFFYDKNIIEISKPEKVANVFKIFMFKPPDKETRRFLYQYYFFNLNMIYPHYERIVDELEKFQCLFYDKQTGLISPIKLYNLQAKL